MLKYMVKDGKPVHGSLSIIAGEFNIGAQQISKLWQKVCAKMHSHLNDLQITQEDFDNNNILINAFPDTVFDTDRIGKCGAKQKYDREALKDQLKQLPSRHRRTYKHAAEKLCIPVSVLHKIVKKEKVFRRHRNRLKPVLNNDHKIWRVMHALSKIDQPTINLRQPKFRDMYDEIHLDEKWFFLTKDGMTYILADDEEVPVRRTSHKSHIAKVMFLCAQARPRFDHAKQQWWDGKLGIWPVGEFVEAKRDSVNRPAGYIGMEGPNHEFRVVSHLALQ